ncbi:MAG: GPW/gp25 family protein [Coprobacillus sp.]|nr:GPW/gp25 family protein [Coprobacillus sp.]
MRIDTEFIGFDYQKEAGTIAEIKRNVETLINTPAGTCPGDRNYGVSIDYVGQPGPIAQNQTAIEIVEKVEEYEPRVVVVNIDFSHGDDGNVILIIRLGRNEDYVEEDEE